MIADQPDAVEQQIQRITEYLTKAVGFVGHMASNHPNEFITAVSTIFVAIFTAVLATATIRLWNSTADLARFAEQQAADMKASIAASEKAAKAAQRSADIAERTLVLTSRPWIGIKVGIASPLRFTAENCTIDIKVTRRNYGRSPGLKGGYYLNFIAGVEKAIDTRLELEEDYKKRLISISYGNPMFPDDPMDEIITNSITRAEMEEAQRSDEKGRIRLFVVAFAFYALPTGGRFRYTSLDQEIVRKGADDYGFDGSEREFAIDEIELLGPDLGDTT